MAWVGVLGNARMPRNEEDDYSTQSEKGTQPHSLCCMQLGIDCVEAVNSTADETRLSFSRQQLIMTGLSLDVVG